MIIKRKELDRLIKIFLNEDAASAASAITLGVMSAAREKLASDLVAALTGNLVTRMLPSLYKLSQVGQKTLENPLGKELPFITDESPADEVKEVQRVLFSLRYNIGDSGPSKNGIDGKYGTSTTSALKKFRADKQLPNNLPPKQVGPATAIHLLAAIKKLGKVASATDKRPPPRDAMGSPEEIPLEKIQGLSSKVVDEPFAIDPQISPKEEPWTKSGRQATITRAWDRVEPETKNFISAIPAAMASLGLVDKGQGDGETPSKEKAANVINSVYRGPMEQSSAMYNGPYRWELRMRKGADDLDLDPKPTKGDYFFSRKGMSDDVFDNVNKAIKQYSTRATFVRKGGDRTGTYGEGGWPLQVYNIFEKHTAGDLDNHASKKSAAIKEAEPVIAAAYKKKVSGHAAGTGIDLSTREFSQAQLSKIIDRIEAISNVNFNIGSEADHYHITLAESIYKSLYEEE
jgi:peptidoglycan hydrolase-like protein with peptidoglycan-binding domain